MGQVHSNEGKDARFVLELVSTVRRGLMFFDPTALHIQHSSGQSFRVMKVRASVDCDLPNVHACSFHFAPVEYRAARPSSESSEALDAARSYSHRKTSNASSQLGMVMCFKIGWPRWESNES